MHSERAREKAREWEIDRARARKCGRVFVFEREVPPCGGASRFLGIGLP